MSNILAFKPHELEAIAKIIADALSMSEIQSRLANAEIPTNLSASGTKRWYLNETLESWQRITGNAQDIVSWIGIVMQPVNFVTRPETRTRLYFDLHAVLSACGYDLREDGVIVHERPVPSTRMERAQDSIIAPGSQETNDNGPATIRESLARFRKVYPDPQKTGFIMMRFGPMKPLDAIAQAIKSALRPHGLTAIRADDGRYHDDLYPNLQTYMHGCGFGIAVFDRISSDLHNANVALEVGYMLALRKPVCLLKDDTLTSLQTDLAGKIIDPFNTHDIGPSINSALQNWLRDQDLL